jgi:membrane-bound lytic murein transglycosylase D
MKWIKRIAYTLGAAGFLSFTLGLNDSPTSAKESEPETQTYRSWEAPNFSNQTALGYDEKTFEIPEGMKERVEFWMKIYSEYSTSEGILHDQESLLVYEKLDFSDFEKRLELSEGQKDALRRARVKEAKRTLSAKLARFATLGDPTSLSEEDQKLYHVFDKTEDKDKFKKAAQMGNIRFQLGQKDRFLQGIFYAGRYLADMEKIFQEAGLPKELTRLPFVESSFNIFAMSRVGASGIWQIMPSTGRLYKLRLDSRVDERNDPWRATEAAAKILKFNHEFLGNWPLALTAYNHGPSGVKKLTQSVGSKNIVDIIQRGKGRRFGFASENFFACFLAALEVEKRAKEFFGVIQWSAPLEKAEIKMAGEVPWSKVVEWFGRDEELARLYNPHLQYRIREGTIRIPSGAMVRVPLAKERVALEWMNSAPPVPLASVQPLKVSLNALEKEKTYRVHRGDTLGRIAQKFQVSMNDLQTANNIGNTKRLRVGQKLVIPN